MDALGRLGWTEDEARALARLGGRLRAGRVCLEHRPIYAVDLGDARVEALLPGRQKRAGAAEQPVVGDWVALRVEGRRPTIEAVLPRRTKLSRRAAGPREVEQVLVANVDTALVLMGLDGDYNPRRLERYLAIASAGGVGAVVTLSKADLCPDAAARRAEVEAVARGAPVLALSLLEPGSGDALAPWLAPARTLVLLGSSGVGKSTLANRLLGADAQRTGGVRAHDSRGKHTTTRREMFALPSGALLIDTPGLRELQLWGSEGLEGAFDDVAALAEGCRFADCRHGGEPGCAVAAAVAAGALDPARLSSYVKLRDELARGRPRRR